ncbi:hypothetical protein KM043_002085 [Ampulex compressa]|nr:hypothetical protein KM043_002085 [Ampulex compressa]
MDYETLAYVVILLLILFMYLTRNYNFWHIRDVKGPRPVLGFGNFVGASLGLVSMGDYLKRIYDKYKNERMIGVFSGTEPLLLLKDPALIKDVLIKDFSVFADRGIHTDDKIDTFAASLFTIDPERWRPLRMKLSTVFSSGKLKEMFHILLECSDHFERFMERIVARGEPVDCRMATSKFTADVIGACAFGIDCQALEDEDCTFLRMSKRIMQPTFRTFLKETMKAKLPWLYGLVGHLVNDPEVAQFFISTVKETLAYRKKHNIVKHDFMDLLLDLKEHPEKLPEIELTDRLIAAQAVVFFVAGFHSSALTMSHALYELARNQEVQDKLRAEIAAELERTKGAIDYDMTKNMKYLDAVFKETLRKYPAVMILMRKALENYRFSGTKVVIPKGQKVWIPIYAIHRDSNIYPEPEVFDPERFGSGDFESANPMSYLPFGDGSRNCIGARFAHLQTKVGLIKIIKNFKVEVCEKTPSEYKTKCGTFLLIPKEEIFVKMTKIEKS